MEKLDFKKVEKQFYLPKRIELIQIPMMNFITIDGSGAPSESAFQGAIEQLYAVAYTISMSYKQNDVIIVNFTPFVVPPLEGLWTSETTEYQGDKDKLIWKIMLRMPDFVNDDVVKWAKAAAAKKKKKDFSAVKFAQLTDGFSVQAIHIGSFDEEIETFDRMVEFAAQQGYKPIHKDFHHREIYLSDFRKTVPEKLKTVLRLFLEEKERN